MRYLFSITILMLLPIVTYAQSGDYQLYSCKTYSSALVCDSSCSKMESTASFKVNVEKNLIITNVFDAGKLTSSYRLRNCSVVNNNNWQCEFTDGDRQSFISAHDEVHDGIYSFTQNGSDQIVRMFRCGRKINLVKKLFD